MAKTTDTYEVKIHTGNKTVLQGKFKSLEEADKKKWSEHTEQCTWEDIEDGLHKGSYSEILHFRDGEHYNDLYFIHPTK